MRRPRGPRSSSQTESAASLPGVGRGSRGCSRTLRSLSEPKGISRRGQTPGHALCIGSADVRGRSGRPASRRPVCFLLRPSALQLGSGFLTLVDESLRWLVHRSDLAAPPGALSSLEAGADGTADARGLWSSCCCLLVLHWPLGHDLPSHQHHTRFATSFRSRRDPSTQRFGVRTCLARRTADVAVRRARLFPGDSHDRPSYCASRR